MLSISFISTDWISWQTPCRLFVGLLGRIGELILCSMDSGIYIDVMCLTYHTSSLPLVVILFRILASWILDIPKWPLNSTDRIAHKSQRVEIQAVTEQTAVWEALEQIKSHGSSQSVYFKSRSGRDLTAYRLFRPQGKVSDNTKINYRIFYGLLRQCIHF
jgi:hypothetical protein